MRVSQVRYYGLFPFPTHVVVVLWHLDTFYDISIRNSSVLDVHTVLAPVD